jgi:tRNA(Ile)-lysidine synthase
MKDKVIKYIKKYKMINSGDGVLVAVSGGPDSICLLHILHSLRYSFNLRLMVIHINHLIRGEHAEEDETYVRDLCQEWDIPFYAHREDIKLLSRNKGISIEEAGREVRYNCFYKIKESHKLQKIALGQHRDDNAETILMRILRGTGPSGLAGISPHREDGVIRPLLSCTREEILDYCKVHKLFPKTDESNLQPIYFRNKIRLEVLPYLEQYNGNLKSNLQNLGEIIWEQQDYINNEMGKLWSQNINKSGEAIILSMNWLAELSAFEQKEMLRRSIEWVKGNLKEIEHTHIQLIVEMMEDKSKTTWTLQLPQEIRIKRQYKQLIIKQGEKDQIKPFCYSLPIGEKFFIPELNLELNLYLERREDVDIIKSDSKKGYFDYEKIGAPIFVRNRIPGDTFKPSGNIGSKKIKDYFIDIKVPRDKRDEVPLVVSEKGIIWVVGYRVDERYVVDENTNIILTIECKHKEAVKYAQ